MNKIRSFKRLLSLAFTLTLLTPLVYSFLSPPMVYANHEIVCATPDDNDILPDFINYTIRVGPCEDSETQIFFTDDGFINHTDEEFLLCQQADDLQDFFVRLADTGCGSAGISTGLTFNGQEFSSDGSIVDPADEEPDCTGAAPPFGWILCGFIEGLGWSINFLIDRIGELLNIRDEYYTNESFVNAWRAFRNLAYGVLVPIVLVMVIGTALGFEAVSAYTVRRALPRLAVATVGIALSYELCVFAVELFNVLGAGALGIVTAPFGGQSAVDFEALFGSGNWANDLLNNALAFGAFILFIYNFWFIGLFIAILAGFLVLIIRQVLIICMILLAPLALLAWILPGSNKLWGLWFGTFSKLLMMFPLVMLLIGAGQAVAWLIIEVDLGEAFTRLYAVTAYGIGVGSLLFIMKFLGVLGSAFSKLQGGLKNQGWAQRGARAKEQRKERKAQKKQRRIQQSLAGTNREGFGSWRRHRDNYRRWQHLRQTGQLDWRQGLVGRKGREQYKKVSAGLMDRGVAEGVEAAGATVGGNDALNNAARDARNAEEFDELYNKYSGGGLTKAQIAEGRALAEESYTTEGGPNVKMGSRAARKIGRRLATKSATNFSTENGESETSTIDQRRKMMEEVVRSWAEGVASGEEDFAEAVNGIREATSRPDISNGDWTGGTATLLGAAVGGVRAAGSNYNRDTEILSQEDVKNHGEAVLQRVKPGELAQGNYRATKYLGGAMADRIEEAHTEVQRTRDAEARAPANLEAEQRNSLTRERQEAEDRFHGLLGEYRGLADNSTQLDERGNDMLAPIHGRELKNSDNTTTTIWDASENARNETAYRQRHNEYTRQIKSHPGY